MPVERTLDIEHPSGLRHIIFNSATAIDGGSIQLVRILFRNDREECSWALDTAGATCCDTEVSWQLRSSLGDDYRFPGARL